MGMQTVDVKLGDTASLTGLVHPASAAMPGYDARPAVLVVPGGGYNHCSDREAEPVMLQFAAAGYQAFVLRYGVMEQAADWQPMKDLTAAMLYLRSRATELNIAPGKIGVIGFSAGGHLAACGGMLWDAPELAAARGGADAALVRPDALMLGYPVISSGEFAHPGSFDKLAADNAAMRSRFSLETAVRPDMPPVFVWHNQPDATVPVENSLLLAQAVQENKVPFELHIFSCGDHGMSICTNEVGTPGAHNAKWLPLCLEWLAMQFDFKS